MVFARWGWGSGIPQGKQELGRLLPVRGDGRAQRDETGCGVVVGFGLVLLLKSSSAVFDFPWKAGQGESSQGCAGSGGRCFPSRVWG